MSKPLDAVVADLMREAGAWESIAVHVTVGQNLLQPIGKNKAGTASSSKEYYIETSSGKKYYNKSILKNQGDQNLWLSYCDGRRCASVQFKKPPNQAEQKSITISKTFMDEQVTGYVMRPEPLRFHYVGRIPLHEAILTSTRIGSGQVAGRNCDIFLFSAVPGERANQDLVYHLDAATSIPMKVEAFANQSRFKSAKPSWVWEAITLDDVQGFHVARDSRYTGFVVDDVSDPTPKLINNYKVDSLKFNEKFDDKTFWPTYKKNVFINDLIGRRFYYNTHDKKAPPKEVAKVVIPAGESIIAPEPDISIAYFSVAGIALGITLLVLGGFLRNRIR